MIGCYISGSGCEDILFQSGLCSYGSINSVIAGKRCNSCWLVHGAFAEAIKRLFLKQYLPAVPENL